MHWYNLKCLMGFPANRGLKAVVGWVSEELQGQGWYGSIVRGKTTAVELHIGEASRSAFWGAL